jgi:hypothetical protein
MRIIDRSRRRRLISAAVVLIGAAGAVGSCGGDGDDPPEATTTRPVGSVAVVAIPIDDACAVVTAGEASTLVGEPMVFAPETLEAPVSSCKYVSVDPQDSASGRVFKQLRVDIYEGSQFFDLDGVGYPKADRENLALGDRGFVHTGDVERGVTVQFEIDEAVYQVNYTERAILTDDPADASRISDALVRLLQDRFADWTP